MVKVVDDVVDSHNTQAPNSHDPIRSLERSKLVLPTFYIPSSLNPSYVSVGKE